MTVDFTQGPPVPQPEEPEFVPPPAPPAPPCTIVFKSGKRFKVTELDSWQWHDRGMFATGRFEGGVYEGAEEDDILAVNESIDYIKFDFAAIQVPEVGPGE